MKSWKNDEKGKLFENEEDALPSPFSLLSHTVKRNRKHRNSLMSRAHDSSRRCNRWPVWEFRFLKVSYRAAASATVFSIRWMQRWKLRHEFVRVLHEPFDIFVLLVDDAVALHATIQLDRMVVSESYPSLHLCCSSVGVAYLGVPSAHYHRPGRDKKCHGWLKCCCAESLDQRRKPSFDCHTKEQQRKTAMKRKNKNRIESIWSEI